MKYHVIVTFNEPLLGTAPLDKTLYTNYVLEANAAGEVDGDEVDTVRNDEKGRTGFHRNEENQSFMYDYAVRGFFKAAAAAMNKIEGSESSAIKAYRKVVDTLIFVEPRQIPLQLAGPITWLERPLRASTPQGDRVALTASEAAPTGTKLEFEIITLDDKRITQALITEWLNYGQYNGLGQWRNGGYGRFTATISKA